MPSFTPPTTNEDPPYLEDSTPLQKHLYRHLATRPAGRNVYLWSNNTVSELDPDGSVRFWSVNDEGRGSNIYVSKVWWGGHVTQTVSAAEQTLLEAAGYTVV